MRSRGIEKVVCCLQCQRGQWHSSVQFSLPLTIEDLLAFGEGPVRSQMLVACGVIAFAFAGEQADQRLLLVVQHVEPRVEKQVPAVVAGDFEGPRVYQAQHVAVLVLGAVARGEPAAQPGLLARGSVCFEKRLERRCGGRVGRREAGNGTEQGLILLRPQQHARTHAGAVWQAPQVRAPEGEVVVSATRLLQRSEHGEQQCGEALLLSRPPDVVGWPLQQPVHDSFGDCALRTPCVNHAPLRHLHNDVLVAYFSGSHCGHTVPRNRLEPNRTQPAFLFEASRSPPSVLSAGGVRRRCSVRWGGVRQVPPQRVLVCCQPLQQLPGHHLGVLRSAARGNESIDR